MIYFLKLYLTLEIVKFRTFKKKMMIFIDAVYLCCLGYRVNEDIYSYIDTHIYIFTI